MRTNRLATLVTLLACVAGITGCSSAEPAVGVGGTQRAASLTVIVWSAHTQRPVAADGLLTCIADGTRREINTRTTPDAGTSITDLAPGAYRVQITRRADPSGRPKRVDGVEDIYLEPGQRAEVTIVVTDREGELGLRDAEPSSTSTSSSFLPLMTTRAVGPS
jgi:hypothetical protein